MTKFAVLCGASLIAMMPIRGFAADANSLLPRVQGYANWCAPDRCVPSPSYYDTPPHLRPQVFYGYEPHRYRGYYEYRHRRDVIGDGQAWDR
jgi:hypothetical protein